MKNYYSISSLEIHQSYFLLSSFQQKQSLKYAFWFSINLLPDDSFLGESLYLSIAPYDQ